MRCITVGAGLFVLFVLFTNCKKDNDGEKKLAVGDKHQGGIVAYLLEPRDQGYDSARQHGLIVAEADLNNNNPITWGPDQAVVFQTRTVVGAGPQNTANIVAAFPGSHAAHLCNDLKLNGYEDWYLPSLQELYEVIARKRDIGSFPGDRYWSSSMAGGGNPDRVNGIASVDSAVVNMEVDRAVANVRAVRSF